MVIVVEKDIDILVDGHPLGENRMFDLGRADTIDLEKDLHAILYELKVFRTFTKEDLDKVWSEI